MPASTMFDKIWDQHVVASLEDGSDLLYIDRHIMHDLTSMKAFADLEAADRAVRRADLTIGVQDHLLATNPGRDDFSYAQGTVFIQAQRRNAEKHNVALLDIHDAEQGIVHIVGPELGITLPGVTLVCGDSHTCTNGGLGALALGIGTSDVTHVLATQTLPLRRPKAIRVTVNGRLNANLSAKDMILHIIRSAGAAAGNGSAVEYAGSAVKELPVEARLTLCNMSIEWGARIGMVAPDDLTYAYLHGRTYVPKDADWDAALAYWQTLPTDAEAKFAREFTLDAADITPQITWGTSPMDAIGVGELIPDPDREPDLERRAAMDRALRYMDLKPGTRIEGVPIDMVFIGSCTNSRISDLRSAATVAKGRKVAPGIRAMVVPGSTAVKRQAEGEGLDRVFKDAGFEWHESACSMCAAVNADFVAPGARCVSTSNRNYENRQGREARTHLASPAMAAGAAVAGK
ncbi:MAG: 3-isopropylmalate dehydratase large subunit, partial [Vulcanimicrobiaceae bacterium]